MAKVTRNIIPRICAIAVGLYPLAAIAGSFVLEPGRLVSVDTAPQGYTTIVAHNLGQEFGRLIFPGTPFPPLEIAPGEQIELNARLGRTTIQAENKGLTRIRVTSRYMDRPLYTP